ncbi:MAG: tRNA 2-thiouridine(34) synthase MnmA [Proteobacteria bacterium]|nr:tRNA 2-thiouridine(34) synthase MnmA [Pseudomonadota bacterium]MBU1716826.1 tRNA 2-thiouridine(34) synthase MnmA [Pseudomonadota bacterium]
MKEKKIAVAMSGGVDSSVTAALLQKQGHEVRGVFMDLGQPKIESQIARVRKVADFLGIPLQVVELREEFSRQVIDYFEKSYFMGLTPNPCVVCNRLIKCGAVLRQVLADSVDLMATGHYARIRADEDGGFQLLKGLDPKKDQSYFLSQLTLEQLSKLCFPLGEFSKEHVYKMAAEFGFEFSGSEESQDICFLKDSSVAGFLAERQVVGQPTGEIVTLDGRTLGAHQGIYAFTIGQRRGLGIPDATPYYVVGIDADSNRVVVGKEDDLWRSSLQISQVNWLAGSAPQLPAVYEVKIRYRHPVAHALVENDVGGGVTVTFSTPQRAITPGQFAVFYDGDRVIGGGPVVA